MRAVVHRERRSLSNKLRLTNALAGGALLLIFGGVIFSFNLVGQKSSEIADISIEEVVRNARAARELSEIFSDIDQLEQTFHEQEGQLESQGALLLEAINAHHKSTSDRPLGDSLNSLSQQLTAFLQHAAVINEILGARALNDERSHAELTALEALISDQLIEATLRGEDTDYIVQQLALVNGYRESLLRIGQRYAELDLNAAPHRFSAESTALSEAIAALSLRMQTVTAATPDIARHGRILIGQMERYVEIISSLVASVQTLASLKRQLGDSRLHVLSAIAAIDETIAEAAQTTAADIQGLVLGFEVAVVLSMLGVTLLIFALTQRMIRRDIHEPMQDIVETIGKFRLGDLKKRVEFDRKDEWETIGGSLNDMAAALDHSRDELQAANEKLETRVGERTRELAETVDALAASEARLLEAQRIAHLGHWSWHLDTGTHVWSQEQSRIFGLIPGDSHIDHNQFLSFLHPDDSQRVQKALSVALANNQAFSEQYRIVRQDGSVRWLESQGHIKLDDDDQPILVSGTALDITEPKRIEQLLVEEKERAMVTLHSIGDAVIATDSHGNVDYLNPIAEKLTGFELVEAQGKPLNSVFHIVNEETRKPAEDPVSRCLRQGQIVGLANHTILVSRTGIEYAIQDSAAPIKTPDGKIVGVVLVFSDVTEARRLSRQMSFQATHDNLTGLTNRSEFERRLERVVDTARASGTDNALGFLDLDQFKLVNDTCGHIAGDELLRQISTLLQENVRHRDTIARIGGDEFGLLMEHCTINEAQEVAQKLVTHVSNYEFVWSDKRFRIGVSIGLVAVNESSTEVVGLMSAADTACYMAKEQGRNRVHIFKEDDEQLAKHHGDMQWAVRLPRALEEGKFQLYCQPMRPVVGADLEGYHYEILVRLEDGHLVLPKSFLPAADRYQLSSLIDRWVIATTFRWIAQHPEHLRDLYLCAINLSGHSLNAEGFLEFINGEFERSAIPPEKICFEITETVAIANFSQAEQFIRGLKDQGCKFALDDFGSGLSSFAYLKNLPVDFLKIDGTFIQDMLSDSMSLSLVKSINEIGQVMGMKTVAEFVEDEDTMEKLQDIGVDYVQGYWIGPPQPMEEVYC